MIRINSVEHRSNHPQRQRPVSNYNMSDLLSNPYNPQTKRNKISPLGWVSIIIAGSIMGGAAVDKVGEVLDAKLTPLAPTEELAPAQRVNYFVNGEQGTMEIAKEFHDGDVTKLTSELQRQANLHYHGTFQPGAKFEIPISQINREEHPPVHQTEK